MKGLCNLGRLLAAGPPLPRDVFGTAWGRWIIGAAEAASCPLDYVSGPLVTAASTLVGHSRWAQAPPGWAEPPYLWIGMMGEADDGLLARVGWLA